MLHTRTGAAVGGLRVCRSATPAQDLAAIHLGLPTAAKPVQFSDADLRAFDAQYCRASGYPAGTYRDALVAPGARWLLLLLGDPLPGLDFDDREWGGLSVRRRVVARLALFARLSTGRPVADVADDLAQTLARRWSVTFKLPSSGKSPARSTTPST